MDIIKPSSGLPRFGRRRWLLVAIAALLLVGLLLLLNSGRALPSTSRAGLWVDTAQRGDMLREIHVSGSLVPRDVRWITAGTAATVQDVLVQPGAQVGVDTQVLRLVNPAVTANLQRARATLAGAEADVAARRTALASQLLDQQSALARAEAASQISRMRAEAQVRAEVAGIVSRVDAKQSEITARQDRNLADLEHRRVDAFHQAYRAQMQAALAQRDQAASALAIAQQEADALTVRASIDGILQQLNVEPGQQVQAGTSLARVARPDRLIARLLVPETQGKDLSLQLPVSVDTHSGVVPGKVSRIDPLVREGSVAIDVEFMQPLPAGMRPDLSVDGRIVLDKLHDVISIGRPALAAPGARASLFVLEAGGDIARRMPVTYGAASSDRIEIRRGLKAGDQVILSDTSQWNQHDALRVR